MNIIFHPNNGKAQNFPFRNTYKKNGFTLLEVILSIAIMTILIGSVFTITNSSLLLSQSIASNQSEFRHKSSFENYLETLFIDLPHNAQFELSNDKNGYQTLTIHNPGTYFPSLKNDRYAAVFIASTIKNRNGLLDLKTTWSSQPPEFDKPDFQQSLTLIGDLTSIRWQIYSTIEQTWYSTWSKELARPSHIRIIYSSDTQNEYARTLWIPPRKKVQ